MIVFLTLLYVGALAVAVKVGVIKLNLFWKISPALWMLLLFVILFLPMQWGAPGGAVNVYQYVVEIVPNVSGEVIDVPIEPLQPLQRGDVLFRIDPVPFQAKVDQLKAQLEASIQNVEQLAAASDAAAATVGRTVEDIEIRGVDVKAAAAKVRVAEAAVQQAQAQLDKATSLVTDLTVQTAASSRELDRQKELLARSAASESEVDRAEVQYAGFLSQSNAAEAELRAAEQDLIGSGASLEFEKSTARSVELELNQLIQSELPRVKSLARQAKLAAEAMIGDEHTLVAEARAQLAAAQFDLDQTTVRAPSTGHVVALSLRPGQRVASFPMRSWMAFVDMEKTEVVVAVNQYALRNVRPGQKAELTLKMFPGRIVEASVNRIIYSSSSGQLVASGQLATDGFSGFQYAEPYAVVLDLQDESLKTAALPGGASGSAAIYTDSMAATHIIRRVMIRMDAWMNYIIP
jgi:multidrug resistance efflux pump